MDQPYRNTVFDLSGRVAVITGGSGLLAGQHASVLAAARAIPVLVDIRAERAEERARDLARNFDTAASAWRCDITNPEQVRGLLGDVLARYGRVDILVNNAANDPKVEASGDVPWSRIENFPLNQWHSDINVGLTGAFLCCQFFGTEMARRGRGVIVNIASDLSLIAPDQRLYSQPGVPDELQPVKPVTYSVVKTGLVGLTRYLATYWAGRDVRVNAISPGGAFNQQPEEFVRRLSELVPLGRMARLDEYQGALLFLCSDASSYMTGANLVVDGGRSVW